MKKLSLILLLISASQIAFASENRVKKVYSCNNDIGIEVENAGWYVVLESDVGEKRLDRLLSIALTLLATQAPLGYVNPGQPVQWCGLNAKPISVMQATRIISTN